MVRGFDSWPLASLRHLFQPDRRPSPEKSSTDKRVGGGGGVV